MLRNRNRKHLPYQGHLCPKCSDNLTRVSGFIACKSCGPLQGPTWWGERDDYYGPTGHRDGHGGRATAPREFDSDNPPAIGLRPGREDRELK